MRAGLRAGRANGRHALSVKANDRGDGARGKSAELARLFPLFSPALPYGMTETTRRASVQYEAPAESGELPRRLGLWSSIAVVVGITIGSGIFRTPASVTDRLPGPLPLFGVWIAGGIVALFGALTLAEVAGAYPNTGGIFVFIRKAWGRLPAFLFGWAELAIIRAAAVGAIATTFSEYLLRIFTCRRFSERR